jgi:hypothetical protein
MGSQSATLTMNNLNERITNVTTTAIQKCEVNVAQDQNQVVNLGGWFSAGTSVSAVQNTEISSKCFSNSALQSKIQDQIVNEIAATTDASGVSALPAFGDTSAEQTYNLKNIIRNNVTMTNIQKNYTKILQRQKQQINANTTFQFGTTLTATQGSKAFSDAVLQTLMDSGVTSAIQTQLQASASATSANPLAVLSSIVSSMFGGLSSLYGTILGSPFMFVLMIGVILLLVSMWNSGATADLGKGGRSVLENL